MSTMRRVGFRVFTVLLVGTSLTGCGLFLPSEINDEDHCTNYDEVLGCLDGPERTLTMTLTNSSDLDVHLFISGETFPCCKVGPGSSRTATYLNVRRGGNVRLTAGRNGNEFPDKFCKVPDNAFDAGDMRVSWNGDWNC